MKQSRLYLKSAEMIVAKKAWFCCTAIYMLKHKKRISERFFTTLDPEALAIGNVFSNPKFHDTLFEGTFGSPRLKKNQEHRVIALCLMSAIMEEQGF